MTSAFLVLLGYQPLSYCSKAQQTQNSSSAVDFTLTPDSTPREKVLQPLLQLRSREEHKSF